MESNRNMIFKNIKRMQFSDIQKYFEACKFSYEYSEAKTSNNKYVPNKNALSIIQKYKLLAALMYVMDKNMEMKVIIDSRECNYAHRVLDVIESLDPFIPSLVQSATGFSTYKDPMPDTPNPNGIKLRFYVREAEGKISGFVLKLTEGEVSELPEYVTSESDILEFSKKIVNMSEVERKNLFEDFQKRIASGNATAQEYILLLKRRMDENDYGD